MLVHHFLERSADRASDSTAVIDACGAMAYGPLDARANRFAHLLLDGGVRRGDRVLLALENSREWIAWYFAILKVGAIAVPLPHGARNDRFEAALVDCTPVVCVTDWRTAQAARPALDASMVRV